MAFITDSNDDVVSPCLPGGARLHGDQHFLKMANNNMNNYGMWDLAKLREALRERGARVSGRKRELIER